MPSTTTARSATSRRRFLQLAGLTAVASTVSARMTAWAQTRTTSSTPSDSTQTPAPPPISDDARSLATLVQRRYGEHLSPAQLEAVTREIENRLQGGKRLRDVRLANHNEPDFVFAAE